MARDAGPMLYDAGGRPLRPPAARDLVRRVAQPTPLGWRRSQQWRSVVGTLNPAQLRAILDAVARGDWCPDFFELAEQMEERDLHYRGVMQQRRLAAAGEPMDVVPASDAAADRKLADEVREQVVEGAGFHALLVNLLDALGKGVACAEVVWSRRGGRWRPASYHRIDPRWLVFGDDGEPMLVGGDGARQPAPAAGGWTMPAERLEPLKFVYHAHKGKCGLDARGGLSYACVAMFLLKSVAARDWWAFGEVFGLPWRVGRYGQNATDEDIRTLQEAILALAADAGCVIPDSMAIELVSAPSGSGASSSDGLFRGRADWCDSQVSKAVVGQTMTADAGSSRAQAEVHADVRDDFIKDDVRQLCDTLSDQLVAWYCALNHAPRPAGWPRVRLPAPPEEIDLEGITSAIDAGLRVPAAWLRGRLGIPDPQPGEELVEAPAAPERPGPRNPALHAADAALAGLPAGAIAEDLAGPVRAALAAAADADEFLLTAAAAALPDELAEDLALRRFRARVDAGSR